MQNAEDIVELIRNKQIKEYLHSNIELKSNWKQDNGKKISFLSNKNLDKNSWLIIGINDEGDLIIEDEDKIKSSEEKISQHLNQYLDPVQAVISLESKNIDGKYWIMLLHITNPGAVVKWNYKAYKGSGTTLLEMNPEEIMELTITLPGLSDYSAQKCICPINTEYLEEFSLCIEAKQKQTVFNDLSKNNGEEILTRLNIFNTNVARLLFSSETKFRIVAYDLKNEPVINETRFGLYQIISKCFISELSEIMFKIYSIEIRFPERAIKEGLANAVAHASYFDSDGDIIIEIYKNRLLISNLSLPESNFFANKWFSRSHKTVNNLLMETLRIMGVVDELGRGKNLIYTESIKNGNLPPEVIIEKSGRFNRWKLCIYFENLDKKQILLLDRIRKLYSNEHKVLIANALVFWREKKVSEIRKYIDGESFPYFKEILEDYSGPVFYYEKDDRLVLRRWAELIINEGKSSKALTAPEEESLLTFAYDMCTKYFNNILTVKYFRGLAKMGDSPSEITLSSNMLKRWCESGILEKLKKGTYRFIKSPESKSVDHNLEILKERLFNRA